MLYCVWPVLPPGQNRDCEAEAKIVKQERSPGFFSWLENSSFIQAGGAVAQRVAWLPHSSRVPSALLLLVQSLSNNCFRRYLLISIKESNFVQLASCLFPPFTTFTMDRLSCMCVAPFRYPVTNLTCLKGFGCY